jgi:hypothetical protein
MTSSASSPRLACRTCWMETPCRANPSATGARTPGRSSTSSDTWYLVKVSPIGRTGSSAYVESSAPRVPASRLRATATTSPSTALAVGVPPAPAP